MKDRGWRGEGETRFGRNKVQRLIKSQAIHSHLTNSPHKLTFGFIRRVYHTSTCSISHTHVHIHEVMIAPR
mgnify:CR=1 FL=1